MYLKFTLVGIFSVVIFLSQCIKESIQLGDRLIASHINSHNYKGSGYEISDEQCIQACANTFMSSFRSTCDQCASNPPITETLCIHACDNTFYSQYRSICDQCV